MMAFNCILSVLQLYLASALSQASADMSASDFKVDVHTHPIPQVYKQALIDAGYNATTDVDIFVDGFRTPDFALDSYLREREADGYNYSIFSITAPGVNFLRGNLQARKLARELNDQMSAWAKQYPKQLGVSPDRYLTPKPNIR